MTDLEILKGIVYSICIARGVAMPVKANKTSSLTGFLCGLRSGQQKNGRPGPGCHGKPRPG